MKTVTNEQAVAMAVGSIIGVDFHKINLDEFRKGLTVELEHGAKDPETNVTDNDVFMTGKIAWAHLKELPDYYTRLINMEKSAKTKQDGFWGGGLKPVGY